MKLKDRVAIVTGGASGIGKAICTRMATEGADVVVADIAIEQAKEVAKELNAIGPRVTAIRVDATKSHDANQMVDAVLGEFGRIDILVNNVGGTARERKGPFCESTEEVWDWVIDLNLKSVRNCTRAVINHMIERKSGKIVNIGSVAGVKGSVILVDYSAAKAGVIGFTTALAKEVAPYGINVNCVSPGPIETPLLFSSSQERREGLRKTIYLGRFGKPEEIANMAIFLASDEASFMVGQNFIVDGGRSL
jgi:NAD(P)-dependent dehydrogenase (short-subunit alcohol dehydrogenase family)